MCEWSERIPKNFSNSKTHTFSLSRSRSIAIYLSVYVFIYPSISLSIYLSIYLPIYLFIHLSIYLSINQSICLSIYLYIYLSFFLPFFLSLILFLNSSTCTFIKLTASLNQSSDNTTTWYNIESLRSHKLTNRINSITPTWLFLSALSHSLLLLSLSSATLLFHFIWCSLVTCWFYK